MQLEFPFMQSRQHDPQDEPCTCGCQDEIHRLKRELQVAHAYIKVMQERNRKRSQP